MNDSLLSRSLRALHIHAINSGPPKSNEGLVVTGELTDTFVNTFGN